MPIDRTPNSQTGTLEQNADQDFSDGRFLTFCLKNEVYGISILKVREIIGLLPMTAVPGSPEYVRGIINLRGKIIPVTDLSKRFAMGQISENRRNCIVVVDIIRDGKCVEMGLLVESVSEVLEVTREMQEPAPAFGTDVNTSFITAIAKNGDEVVILLDVEKIVLGIGHDNALLEPEHSA